MTRTHGRADIYIDGTLAHAMTVLIEQVNGTQILLKVPKEGRSVGYMNGPVFTEVEYEGKADKGAMKWTGLDAEGERREIVMVPRSGGCQTCGG